MNWQSLVSSDLTDRSIDEEAVMTRKRPAAVRASIMNSA
jgi:hypothetical protein